MFFYVLRLWNLYLSVFKNDSSFAIDGLVVAYLEGEVVGRLLGFEQLQRGAVAGLVGVADFEAVRLLAGVALEVEEVELVLSRAG